MAVTANFIIVIITVSFFHNVRPSCVFQDGKYDLSALDWPSGWPVPGPQINGTLTYYEISICRSLNFTLPSLSKGCPKSYICQISGEKAISFGETIERSSDNSISNNDNNGFSLRFLTRELCISGEVYQATINFACGPNLGAPELILRNDCQVNFSWRTSAACINKPKSHQVPCYILDNEGNKRDLSPLILRKGSYPVKTSDSTVSFTVNVCSKISGVKGCGSNSSACRFAGDEYLSFGIPHGRLQYTQEGLVLSYLTDQLYSEPPKGCSLKPKTTTFFNCPHRDYSQPPMLLSKLNCQYEIKWDTEYACPEKLLKGSLETCQFTTESHGVEIDMSPLKNKPVYNIPSSSGISTFALSVCGGLGNLTCNGKNWKSTSVCANETRNSSVIVGTTEGSHFTYAHHVVILTYPGQESCDNDTNHSSVIMFFCDPDASNNGEGEPKHVSSDHCIHTFHWKTKHACLKPSLASTSLKWTDYCSVYFKNKKINLRKLSIVNGEAWKAINRRNVDHKDNSEYYINVCDQVAHLGNLSNCGEGSSVCVLDNNGKYLNLGNFTSPPIYNIISNSVKLIYTGGSHCKDGKQWKSTIDFICGSGHTDSKPVLVYIDDSECQYKFEWHTAAACPEGFIMGANCRIHDDNLGINYDLTPLKNKVYEVDSEHYKFYISICESLVNSTCSLYQNSSQKVGICREDKINHSSCMTGEASPNLQYNNGVVTSYYLLGDPTSTFPVFSQGAIIIFICDFSAGNGSPQIFRDGKSSYIFHWHTDLVCSNTVSNECMVQDPFSHQIYDLSRLSVSENNGVDVVSESNKESRIFLSVCRSLAKPFICDSNAAACMVEKVGEEEKVLISNLGQPSSLPIIDSSGHLILKYTDGNACIAHGKNVTYSTIIHFLCAKDNLEESDLQFLNKVGTCKYVFLWTTKAACPTGILQSVERCQLTDPDSGFTFDLTPLWKASEPYTIKTYFNTFQLNICGKVIAGCLSSDGKQSSENVSVCATDSKGKSTTNIAVSDSYLLRYSNGRDLSIAYKAFDEVSKIEVIIKFPCSNTAADLNPKFIRLENRQFIFEMKTSLTCIPTHFDCSVIDQYGNEYDLRPLAKYSKINWEVADSRPAYLHLRYHINFCLPLNKVHAYKCPAGSSGACQTSILQNESIGRDLGSQMNEPLVSNKGTIVLHYTDGSYCHNGQFKCSTTVNLFCSGAQEDLKFIGETKECEYIFSLATPAACPVQRSLGSACTLKDPFFGYIFDLNPLKSKNNYNITVGEYNFYLTVCDKLNGLKNSCINSSACQTKPNDPSFSKSLGLPNDRLIYRNGLITLEYKSGTSSCHGKYNRSTRITFTCHHALEGKDGPHFISEAEDCTYLFEWPTIHACPPFDVIECSVIDDSGAYYDLTRLSLPDDNYYVKHPMYEKFFVINVCRSVVHTSDSVCPYTSASCLVDVSNHPVDKPVNLGRASQGPYIDNGKLKINYTSGDSCDLEGTETARFMQTVIEFFCDYESIESKPEFVGRDGCTYYFDWHTIYACESKPIKTTGDCTAEDPLTGYLFNLSSLRNHGLFKYQKGNHQYYVSVCGNNNSSPCGADAGMCQEELIGAKRHWSGGKSNNHLVYNNGIIFLNYSDGDPCHNGHFTRNTLIEFHCGNGIGEPKFLYKSHDCTYFFSWKTELACQTLLHCAIKDGSQYYDLTSIADTFHVATSSVLNDSASYFISFCKPLQKLPKVSCPPGAAICRVQNNGSAESLGRVENLPFVGFMGHVTAIYTNGSTCLRNSNFQNHAMIIFLCDSEAGLGELVLRTEDHECHFIFEWRTSIVCPEKPTSDINFKSCNYIDKSRGIYFSLLPFQKTGTKPYYEVSDGNSSYLLNVCATLENSHLADCKDAGICKTEGKHVHNYGIAESQRITYDGRIFKLTFYDGDDCPSGFKGKLSSEVLFVCNQFIDMGEPVLLKKYTCMAVFLWETSLACQKLQDECIFDIDGSHYDFNLLSNLSHNWNTWDTKNTTFYINLCQGIQQTANTFGCSPAAVVCMVDTSGFHLSLGMIGTVEAKLLNSSDLLLTFNSGDSRACSSLSSNAALKPVTRVYMRCGTKLGQPRFSGYDPKCFYDFVWESSLACADSAVEVMLEKDSIIKDPRFNYSLDITDILNRTFTVNGTSASEQFIYKINLSGIYQNSSDSQNACFDAAVCQTKQGTNSIRDIGSIDSRTFVMRGSEVLLTFVSRTQPCGKNKMRNITSIINLRCVSSAGIGNPIFFYESDDCEYMFDWETIVVCPNFFKGNLHTDFTSPGPMSDPFKGEEPSSHEAGIAVGIIFTLIILMVVVFVLAKPSRRASISSVFWNIFSIVNIPKKGTKEYIRYKRFTEEGLVLVDASQAFYNEDRDTEKLS